MALLDETKVFCGIGKAHKMMAKVNSQTEVVSPASIKYLLAWKENRNDMCTDPVTDGKTLVKKHISAALSLMVKSFSCIVLLNYLLSLILLDYPCPIWRLDLLQCEFLNVLNRLI